MRDHHLRRSGRPMAQPSVPPGQWLGRQVIGPATGVRFYEAYDIQLGVASALVVEPCGARAGRPGGAANGDTLAGLPAALLGRSGWLVVGILSGRAGGSRPAPLDRMERARGVRTAPPLAIANGPERDEGRVVLDSALGRAVDALMRRPPSSSPVIAKIVAHLGLPIRAPPRSPPGRAEPPAPRPPACD